MGELARIESDLTQAEPDPESQGAVLGASERLPIRVIVVRGVPPDRLLAGIDETRPILDPETERRAEETGKLAIQAE